MIDVAAPLQPATPAPSYFPPTTAEVVFVLLGLLTLGAAILCVTSRNVVRSALWLVVALGGVAGCFLVMSAELVALVQVLLYAGAVIVLLLFGLMVTRAPTGPTDGLDTRNRPAAILVALATTGLLGVLLVDAFRLSYVDLPDGAGSAEAIGSALFRQWVLPFEVLSVLLLAALIGAISLSRPETGSKEKR